MHRGIAVFSTAVFLLAAGGEVLAPPRILAAPPQTPGSSPAGSASPTPPPAPCPTTTPYPTLVEYAHYRAATFELHVGGHRTTCSLPIYPGKPPPLPDFQKPDIVLGASGSSLQFTYHIREPEPGVNERLLDGLNLFSDDNIEFSFIDARGDARLVAIVNPSGNCTAIAGSVLQRFAPQPCSVTQAAATEGDGPWQWSGVLSIPVSALPAPAGMIRFFAAMTFQHRAGSNRGRTPSES